MTHDLKRLLFVLCSMMSLTVVNVARSSSDFTCLMSKSSSVAADSVIFILLLMRTSSSSVYLFLFMA